MRSGFPAAIASAALLASGCMYSLTGGGLPSHIDTVAVLPFENATTQPLLDSDVQQALQAELPRTLGVRLAEENLADAVVRGTITGYDETATSVRPSQDREQVVVPQRQVRITYSAEIYDRTEERILWRGQSLVGLGNFSPQSNETATEGKARAISDLVQKLIEGAQSQW
ncbi:MAG TPA: LptE family protein [Longimicrobiaceae bacterium]|nr:LptE family protein [Longimicrobiaceae bacterium]